MVQYNLVWDGTVWNGGTEVIDPPQNIWSKKVFLIFFRLTAFVIKTFCAIQKLDGIDIDQNVINTAINWLSSRQRADGAIPESHPVNNKAMDVSLFFECCTAWRSLALLILIVNFIL